MISRVLKYIRKNGISKTIYAILYILKIRVVMILRMSTLDYWIEARRMELSNKLAKKLDYTVKYGIFKGLKLRRLNSWGGSMFLGLYEKEVLDLLKKYHGTRNTLVDLGAADGFFGIGCIIAKYFDRSYCFDLSDVCKENMRYNASLNKVSDKVRIFGEVPVDFPKKLRSMGINFKKSVVICDIEGNEFTLLTDSALKDMRESLFIIEIHDYVKNGAEEYKNLKLRAEKYFKVKIVKTGSRNFSFPEIANLSDNDRWLLGSEGRRWLTDWLVLIPR